jgi:RNA polymerase subunit RPABC4/transcription elongation factor Spt4
MPQSNASTKLGGSAIQNANGHCRVNLHLRPKVNISDFLNSLDLNNIIVEIDLATHTLKWGKASFEVPPGLHRIAIWLKNPLTTSPKARAEIALQDGEVANVEFTGPVTIFAAGKIDYKVEAAPASQSHAVLDEARVCLACGKRLPGSESHFCPFCGTQAPQKQVCPKCGGDQSGGKFCGLCGAAFE